MYDIYRYIFIGGLVLSLVFLAVTAFLFFFFNIRNIIGDLTGSKKRKAIEDKSSKKAAAPKKTTVFKAKSSSNTSSQLTSRMSVQDRYNALGNEETSILNRQPAPAPQAPPPSQTTTQMPTQAAAMPQAAPAVQAPPVPAQPRQQSVNMYRPIQINSPDFVLETDITYVHSNEVIV